METNFWDHGKIYTVFINYGESYILILNSLFVNV